MVVAELVEQLKLLPQDAEVALLWDGEPRSTVHFVWLTRDEWEGEPRFVVLAGDEEPVYTDAYRPEWAPRKTDDDPYWNTPAVERTIDR